MYLVERSGPFGKRVGKEQTMAERTAAGGLDVEALRRAAETVEVRDGKIVRQVSVQAWDE